MKAMVKAPDEPGVKWMRSVERLTLYVSAYMPAIAARIGAMAASRHTSWTSAPEYPSSLSAS